MQILQEISLDFSRDTLPVAVFAKQFDKETRFVKIAPLDKGQNYTLENGITARLQLTKPDKHTVISDAVIQNNSIIVELTEQALTTAGTAIAEIGLYNGASLLSSQTFYIDIKKSAYDPNAIESTDEIKSLAEIFKKADNTIKLCETATRNANEKADKANTAADLAQTAANKANSAAATVDAIKKAAELATQNANNATTEATNAVANANFSTSAANEATNQANAAATQANSAAQEASAAAEQALTAANSVGVGIIKEILIPSNGWGTSSENPDKYYISVYITEAKASQYPIVTIHPESISIAQEAGLSPVCETLEGNIRFSAESSPTNDISATIALISNGGVDIGEFLTSIPVATAETLGGVKIGDGIESLNDGTISPDFSSKTATDKDVTTMLNNVFDEI